MNPVFMSLRDYLASEGALTEEQLREAIGAKSTAQIRQWRTGTNNRRPSAAYAAAIEHATEGRLPRWVLRPLDWHRIWPDLVGTAGTPPVPAAAPTALRIAA